MTTKGLVTLIGGSGFIGRYAAKALLEAGYTVRIGSRSPASPEQLGLAEQAANIDCVACDLTMPDTLKPAMEGAMAAVNLVGILFESGGQTFERTQEQGARHVADAASAAGISHFVHVSAIGADPASKSGYGKTKAAAEDAVRQIISKAVILRPSIVFGPEDQFFNRFADMAKFAPALPAIGGGKTRLQPVYVGDVAHAIVRSFENEAAGGKTFELGGPGIYSFNQLYDFIFEHTGRKRAKLPLPFTIAKPMGAVMAGLFKAKSLILGDLFGGPPITGDQVEMLKSDNVVAEGALTLADLGIATPRAIEDIVPDYLQLYR
ncbi:MAG: complex I NDUFA9 subunit family protein [Pseudomonadota bacterium]